MRSILVGFLFAIVFAIGFICGREPWVSESDRIPNAQKEFNGKVVNTFHSLELRIQNLEKENATQDAD